MLTVDVKKTVCPAVPKLLPATLVAIHFSPSVLKMTCRTCSNRNDATVGNVKILSLNPGRKWTVDPSSDHLDGTARSRSCSKTNELKLVSWQLQKEIRVWILDIQTLHAHLFGQWRQHFKTQGSCVLTGAYSSCTAVVQNRTQKLKTWEKSQIRISALIVYYDLDF